MSRHNIQDCLGSNWKKSCLRSKILSILVLHNPSSKFFPNIFWELFPFDFIPQQSLDSIYFIYIESVYEIRNLAILESSFLDNIPDLVSDPSNRFLSTLCPYVMKPIASYESGYWNKKGFHSFLIFFSLFNNPRQLVFDQMIYKVYHIWDPWRRNGNQK